VGGVDGRPTPYATAVLLLLDFDGTITSDDTLDVIVKRYAPETWDPTEQALATGEMTLNEVIAYQFERVYADRDELVAFVRASVTVRPGLPELIDLCRERFIDPVVVSAGFVELIEPVLHDAGVALPVIAHHAAFSAAGGRVTFLERETCPICGEQCKRMVIPGLAAGRQVAYVGDGWSDRCGAKVADLAFARASLASYLADEGVPFVPFDDFGDVRRGLQAFLATA
jgi:2,3-diketo-5-methylthio-1-phosphopentane phosphatase